MRDNRIAGILREYRKKNHYSVNEVAEKLRGYGVSPAIKTIYGWENGQSLPTADVLLALCEIYEIPDVLAAFGYKDMNGEQLLLLPHEYELVRAYRDRENLQEAVDILLGCRKPPKRKKSKKSK